MLVFTLRCGDDVYIGNQQLIVHREQDGCLVVLTQTEEIDVPLGDEGVDFDNRVRLYCKDGPDTDTYQLGFNAPRDILILTGRNYRRQLEG
jgi:hypothetical protein